MKKNVKNFIWNNVGLTFNCFNSLFFLIIIRYINGTDIAGIFTYSFSLCCLFYIISNYYNRAYQVSDYSNKFNFNTYFSCRIFASLASIMLLLIFSIISKFNFYKIMILLLLMIFRIIESISDCFYAAIQKKDELYKVGISLTVKAIIGLILFLFLDVIFKNVLYSIASLIIINLLIFFVYDLRNYKSISNERIKISTKDIKELLISSFPVFIFSFLSIYIANCHKYILTYYVSNEIQTIFGILIMPATMLSLVGSYMIMPFINKLVTYYNTQLYKSFRKMAVKICTFLIFMGIAILAFCYFFGVPILNFIYSLNLNDYKFNLMIIILSAIMMALSLIISNLLTILGENKKQTIIYLITSIISTLTGIFLIKKYFITGAVYSYFISYLVNVILYLGLYLKKIHNLDS
jgi:O-antigen/teichoic acid export membrane protein